MTEREEPEADRPAEVEAPTTRFRHAPIAMLGLVTITAYGSWYYAFGVLLDPIRLDTGWSESSLATSFSLGSIVMGVGSIFGGRILDRLGNRSVMLIGGIGGGASMMATSFAGTSIVFTITSVAVMAFVGAFGFYHVTMTTAVRVNPSTPSKAIANLTIWGAFASAVYLPLAAALVDRLEWRDTIRVMAVLLVVVFLAAAVTIPNVDDPPVTGRRPPPLRSVLTATVRTPERRAFTAAVAFGGIAMNTVLVYQVPAMTAAGLSLTTASTLAGIRGFAQTGGRIPLTPIVNLLGPRGALILAFAAIAIGGVLLAFAGTVAIGLLFALFTGFGIGAFSPLQGITAEELFDRRTLGVTMGSYSTVLLVAGSTGPATAGFLAESTGDRRITSVVIVVAAGLALAAAVRLWFLRAKDL